MNAKQAKQFLLGGAIALAVGFSIAAFTNIPLVGPTLFFTGFLGVVIGITYFLLHPVKRKA